MSLIVGVTGINAIDNPGPGIGVARSLKEDRELDVSIVGLTYDALEPGNYLDWVIDRSFTIPYPSAGGDQQLERLLAIRDRFGLDCIIPNLDAELPFYIRYREMLEREGIRLCLPTAAQFRLRGKDRLPELAEQMDVRCPATRVVQSHDELAEAIDDLGLPLMVKGVYYEATLVHTREQALVQFDRMAANWGVPVIVQQLVTGEELNVIAVGDGAGGLLGRVGMRKTSVTALGKAWGAVTVEHGPMLAATERFAAESKWRGPFEMECIVDEDDVYLIEINPRFPAWVYFATGVGVNLPARLLRQLFDREVERNSDYAGGRMFVRYSYELVTDMARFQNLIVRGEST